MIIRLKSRETPNTNIRKKDMQMTLVGSWKKITTTKCSEIYPDNIEFQERGIYFGQKEPEAKVHPLWDSGGYEVLSDNQVKISTANDAEIIYSYSISGNVLTFVDKRGCELQYLRVE